MNKTTWLLAAGLTIVIAGISEGQVYVDDGYGPATAGESYANGMANVVRASGAANLMNAQAANVTQDTLSQAMDNRVKNVDSYFTARLKNQQYQQQLDGPSLSQSDYARIAAAGAPDRLAADQLDPATGHINWPTVLTDPSFAEQTSQLEVLFANRAVAKGKVDMSSYQQIQTLCTTLENMLSDKIREMPSMGQMIVQSKNFVRSLAYEARF